MAYSECQAFLEYSKKLLNCYRKERKSNSILVKPNYVIENMFQMVHQAIFFDLVINGGTLEHYNNKEIKLLIIEMLRIIKSGGYAIVVVPNLKNFDINLYKLKIFIKQIYCNKLFKNLVCYGGNDERDIKLELFKSIVFDIDQIDNVIYLRHPIAIPRFIKRRKDIAFNFIEKILAKSGFNWAHIYN